MPISATIARPIQYAEKLPAVRPASTFSDAPPSRDAVTTSLTWRDRVEVKTLTVSGMIAPARVPHEMITDSFHHRPWPRLVPTQLMAPAGWCIAVAPGPIRKYEIAK